MNTTKNIQNAYKGLTALLLVLFFSIAGLSKVFGANGSVLHKTAKQQTGKALFSEVEKQAEITAPADAQDNDADDADWGPNFGTTVVKSTSIASRANNKQIAIYFHRVQPYSNHLYDLYCNWKFDL